MNEDDGGGGRDSKLVRWRILEARAICSDIEEQYLARFDQLTFSEVERLITWTMPDMGIDGQSLKLKTLTDLSAAREKGVRSPGEVPKLREALRVFIPRLFHDEMQDSLTGLGAAGAAIPFTPDPWSIYNPEFLIANFHEGDFGMVSGPPGSGKTNFVCFMAEQFIKKGFRVLGNIKMKEPVEGFTSVFNSQQEAQAIRAAIDAGEPWVLLFDDAMGYWYKTRATSGGNVTQDQFTTVVRHYRGNMIVILQREEAVSSTVQDFLSNWYVCHKPPGLVNIDLGGPRLAIHRRIKDFPRTSLPYDTYAKGMDVTFNVTMTLEQLVRAI